MTSFATLWSSLKLDISDFSSKLNTASKQVDKFGKNLQSKLTSSTAAVDDLTKATKKSGVEFKDVARIVQGIIISKIFYGALGSIRQATDAVWEFSSSLEYAKIAYSNLFDDTALAEEFINVLKDFAATTPFSFSESEQASKRLLAYGVKYQNVMYMMQGIMSAAAMQGDPAKVESISRALGQIYTKGRLMNEEMRQLAEAGIPAYEILKEKLGLTQKQLQNLGDEAIPASVAINALIDGMTERFGNVVTASSKTMTGIVSNIYDNATMLISAIFEPVYVKIKSVANALGELLFTLRDIQETLGTGGVFEYLVPEELRQTLRLFLASVLALHQAIVNLAISLGKLLGPVVMSLINMFNAMAPVLATVINVMAGLINVITSNAAAMRVLTIMLSAAAAMWVLFKIRALGALVVTGVVNALTKSIAVLGAVMTFVAAHPLWALLIALTGIVVGISASFTGLGKKIKDFFGSLTAINGYDPDDLLLPSQEDRANDLDKFNKKLDSTADSMDDLADSTGKATKAAKGLLSFDEVFKLNEPDETGKNSGINFGDFDLGDLGDLSTDAFIPEVPDFTGFSNNWFDALSDALKKKLLSAGIGAVLGGILGAVLGGLVGHPLIGAAIGALAGGIAGWFWNDLADQLGLTEVGKIAIPISTSLGAILGALIGGPGGALIGAGIGTLVGMLIEAIAKGVLDGDWSTIGVPLGTGIGGAIGFVVGGPGGAVIGMAIGSLIGYISDLFIKGFQTGEWNVEGIGTAMGAGVGGAIGFIFGGPPGAAIGAAIGALVGWIASKFSDNFHAAWDAFKQPWIDLGNWFAERAYEITDALAEAFASGDFLKIGINIIAGIIYGIETEIESLIRVAYTIFTSFVGAIKGFFGIHSPATEMMPYGENILLGILEGIVGAITAIPEYLASVGLALVTAIGEWFISIGATIAQWAVDATANIRSFVSDTTASFVSWATTTYNNISTWATNVATRLATWVTETGNNIYNWAVNAKNNIANFATNAREAVVTWASNTKASITTWASTTASKVSTWWTKVNAKFTSLKNVSFEDWASKSLSTISNWATSVASSVRSNFESAISKIKEFISVSASAASGAVSSTVSYVSSTASAAASAAKNAATETWNAYVRYKRSGGTGSLAQYKAGHATGGIFDREHYAMFAEDNKAEAIIPLENNSAMQPFVDAVANGLTSYLAPLMSNAGQSQQMQPLYVGTLIADDRSLKELERKMKVIRMQEDRRG